MSAESVKAELYRKRAEELRTEADALGSAEAQEGLLSVADSYDTIAAALTRIDVSKRKLGLS